MIELRHIVLLLGMGLLFAQDDPPPEFQYNTSMSSAFYYIESVTINDIAVESNDWVGAFRDTDGDGEGDICVGSRHWNTTGFCSDDQYTDEPTCTNALEEWSPSLCTGMCDVPIMGSDGEELTEDYMQPGDIPIFKIYDTSENKFYDAIASEDKPWANFGFNFLDNLQAMVAVLGCIDENACNYNSDAMEDDGSCEYVSDCDGVCNGTAEEDNCGTCDNIPENDCVQGCDGIWGSGLSDDECDVCGGDNSSCSDECGVPDGNNSTCLDGCGVPNGNNSSCADCAGVPNGNAVVDMCNECDDNSANNCTQDCTGTWGGDSVEDECGICGGNNSTCNQPTANNSAVQVEEDGEVTFELAVSDPNGNELSVTNLSDPDNGNLVSNGINLTYTPIGDYFGDDTFTYQVSDEQWTSNTAMVTIQVIAMNDAPTANDFTLEVSGSMAVDFNEHVSDADEDLLTILTMPPSPGETLNTIFGGTLTFLNDLEYNYSPPGGEEPPSDFILFKAFDNISESKLAFGTFNLNEGRWSRESETTAFDDNVNMMEDQPKVITLVGFDVLYPFTGNESIIITEAPANGTLSDPILDSTSPQLTQWLVTFTPTENYTGSNQIKYKVVNPSNSNNNGESSEATISITINPVNDLPELDPISDVEINEGGSSSITISATDVDNTLDLSVVSSESSINVSLNLDDFSLNIIPEQEFNGSGTITVTATEISGAELSTSQVFSVNVIPVNDPPIITSVAPDSVEIGNLFSYQVGVEDIDDIVINYSIEGAPAGMNMNGGGFISWSPDTSASYGPITVTASDGEYSDSQEFTLTAYYVDCAGDINGDAEEDNCGTCDNIPENDCVPGCDGIWGSGLSDDLCGVCGGDSSSCEDCNGDLGGGAYYDECETCDNIPENDCVQGCDGNWDSGLVFDECGVCNGDGIADGTCDCDGNVELGCGCGEAEPDECGVCGGDNSSCVDCAGVTGGNAVEDCFGVCGGSAVVDNCGLCNGDNSDCWYIDIEASVFNEPLTYICIGAPVENQEECEEMGGIWSIDLYVCTGHPEIDNQEDCEAQGAGAWEDNNCVNHPEIDNQEDCEAHGVWTNDVGGFSDEQDLNNQIGMHTAAEDTLNTDDNSLYQCGDPNCYMDIPEPLDGLNPEVMFYFPHPEWEHPLGDDFNNYTRDIRSFKDLSTFQIIETWDAVYSSNVIETDIALLFNVINQATLDGQFGFTRVFVLHDRDNDGLEEYTEIEHGDYYTFFHSDINDSLKIIVGAPDIVSNSRVTVISPNGNEIRSTEDALIVELEYELFEFIGNLKLDLQILACSDAAYTTKETCELVGEEWSAVNSFNVFDGSPVYEFPITSLIIENFYNANSNESDDYLSRFSIHAEIIDRAGGDESLFEDYHDDSDNTFTISKPKSTTEFEDYGWYLLSPPLAADYNLGVMFPNPAYGCADGCTDIPLQFANSGIGFYVRSNFEYPNFTFSNGEVLSEFSLPLQQEGWNLIGNPLVTPIDINSLIIRYNNMDLSWWEASDSLGIISPMPIIYDNERASHVGSDTISTAAGFWVESHKANVEILFDPTNPISEPESSSFWSLSLLAKENNTDAALGSALGSEIIVGVHEDAIDDLKNGEDQETFPLASLDDFIDSYTELSIDNGGLSFYRDIRESKGDIDPITTWDISVNSVEPYDPSQGIGLTWELSGNDDPYEYYLDISGTNVEVCESAGDIDQFCIDMKADDEFSNLNEDIDNIKITASLKENYIGCTHYSNVNEYDDFDGVDCFDSDGEPIDCLGGQWAEYCNILSLSFGSPGTDSLISFFSVPDAEGMPFDLPILLSNKQGNEIEGLQFILEYDSDEIELDSIMLDQQLNGNDYSIFQENCPECSPHAKLAVSIINESGNLFTGEGPIFSLSGFGLKEVNTNISFFSILINESESSSGGGINLDFGSVYYVLSGELNYYSSGSPVEDGTFYGAPQGDPENYFIDNTDSEGLFNTPLLLGDATYTLQFVKNENIGYLANYFDGLSALDASRIARHSANLYELTDKKQLAANVNFDYRCEYDAENGSGAQHYSCLESQCSGSDQECDSYCGGIPTTEIDCGQIDGVSWMPNIEAGDASKVAKYAAGIEDNLYDACDPHWIFLNPEDKVMIHNSNCANLPNSATFTGDYELELLSDTTLTFEGIRLGDVSGNWSAPLGRQNENYFVDNPMVEVEPDEIIKLPIYLPNNVEIEGIDLTIQYDPEVFSLIGYSNRNSILEELTYPTIINQETPGIFKLVSYANSTPIYDNGLLGYIKFKVISHTTTHSTISMVEMEVNEIPEGGFLIVDGIDTGNISRGFDFQIIAVPDVFALNQNYPNPFNPSTNIQFDLPNEGEVIIQIYDLKGNLIEELIHGNMKAGYHQLKWNGSNQASGMYFIRMIADNGNYFKVTKMMLVK